MSEYGISQIYPTDRYSNDQVDKLLLAEGIRRDGNLDYTCGMYDDDMNIIATGSCFGNTLRCMAVSSAHQGEGLMNVSTRNATLPSSSATSGSTRSSASRTASSSWRTGAPVLLTTWMA